MAMEEHAPPSAPSPLPARLLKFIKLLARHISHGHGVPASPASLDAAASQELLKKSVSDLPPGKLRSSLEQDLPRFVAALRQELRAVGKRQHAEPVLEGRLLEGSLFADREYCSLVEAVADAAVAGAEASVWCAGARRLLLARKEPPLQLVWAYCTLEAQLQSVEQGAALPSLASALLRRLKAAVLGNASAFLSVAAMAPVVALVFSSTQAMITASEGCMEASEGDEMEAAACKRSGNLKNLQDVTRELLSFIVVHHNKVKRGEDCPLEGLPSAPISCHSLPAALGCFSFLLEALGFKMSLEVEKIKAMFPLISKSGVKALTKHQVKVDDISDMVVAQVLLLLLILECIDKRNNLRTKGITSQLFSQNAVAKMREIAVHSIGAIGGHGPFGSNMLLEVLQSPCLPVGILLNNEEEAVLRGILYEAVLIEQPKFCDIDMLSSAIWSKKSSITFLKKIAVARKAIHYFRSHGERSRAITLLEGVKSFSVPRKFFQWFSTVKIKQEKPIVNAQNLRLLIGWLIDIDDVVFSSVRNKLAIGDNLGFRKVKQEIVVNGEEPFPVNGANDTYNVTESVCPSALDEDLFYIDTKGEEIEDENLKAADKAFTAAAAKMKASARTARKKTKDGVLFRRHNQIEHMKRRRKSSSESESDGLSDASEGSQKAKKRERKPVVPGVNSDLSLDCSPRSEKGSPTQAVMEMQE